jgi:hypothetical protein
LQVTDLDALQSALRSRLVALSSPAEAEVIDLITRWEQVKFSVAKMDQGSVGDTTGLKYDPQERKDTIKQLFSSTLGLMGIYQGQMQKKNAMYGNAADMGPIWVMRG